jgi:Subtilase family
MNLIARFRVRSAPTYLAVLTAAAAAAVFPGAANAASAAPIPAARAVPAHAASTGLRDVCGVAKPGYDRCFAQVRTDVHGGLGVRGHAVKAAPGTAAAAALPQGFGPADLQSAYKLPTTGGKGQTVAIIDAGDDATAEADLAVYRSTYGLPACTTANGCFRKVNEAGASSPLPADQGWGIEISLDLDMVSAACPQCHILLVEATNATSQDLGTSVDTAVKLGANEVSNSYGATEGNGLQAQAADYAHPGVAILASSGDSGYGIPNTPAVYSTVIAVGGTSLTKDSSTRGWSETAWGGAGSGCSAWIDKPSWQSDPNCPGRMVADVSADADPYTGPAVYDSSPGDELGGWGVVGGTSASSPFIAGVIAQAGNPSKFPNAKALYAPSATVGLNDVTGGTNGYCGGDYQCTAVPGYDGPTGMGTPNGLSAF